MKATVLFSNTVKALMIVGAVMVASIIVFTPTSYAKLPAGSSPPSSSPSGSPSASSAVGDAVCEGIDGCNTGPTAKNAGLSDTANFILNLLVVVGGVISVIMIVIGGIKYATSGGDSNAAASAKNTIIYALVGLVVIALAKPLVGLILKQLS